MGYKLLKVYVKQLIGKNKDLINNTYRFIFFQIKM